MNTIIIKGNMTKDPEIRQTRGAKPVNVAEFTVAVRRKFDSEKADFFRCNAFGKQAETIEKYFHKGSGIIVKGRMQLDSVKTETGYNNYHTVIVEEIDFVDKKGEGTPAPAPAPTPAPAPAPAPAVPDGFVDIPDDTELPFI